MQGVGQASSWPTPSRRPDAVETCPLDPSTQQWVCKLGNLRLSIFVAEYDGAFFVESVEE